MSSLVEEGGGEVIRPSSSPAIMEVEEKKKMDILSFLRYHDKIRVKLCCVSHSLLNQYVSYKTFVA